ncbi:unnamed protein product, partial [Protopolystoma xenopodis]
MSPLVPLMDHCDLTDMSQPTVYVSGCSKILDDGEELVMDKSAYRLYSKLDLESSCLSFDIIPDNLGNNRICEVNGESVSLYLLVGSQACRRSLNKLSILRLEGISPMTKNDPDSESTEDDESGSSDNENCEQEIEAASIRHNGTVNRVKSLLLSDRYFAASWSDVGHVCIWDLSRPLLAVNDSATMSEYVRNNESPSPVISFKGHNGEGYALSWNKHPLANGYLASGDCKGSVYTWTP